VPLPETFASSSHGQALGMPSVSAPSVPLSQVGRAAHDVGLAGLLGGNLFGRLALHPSVTEISNQSERGRVVNAAWRRYGVIQSLSLAAGIGGWVGARLDEAADRRLTPEERRLARAKDVLVGVVGVTGIATAAQGMAFSRKAPNGAVPLSDGDHTAPQATAGAKRAKRRVNVLGTANLVSELALVSVNAALEQRQHRRPALRRLVPFVGRT
jgi:hypothetical protein